MNKKYRSAIFSLGVGLGILLVLITVMRIGWIPFILLLVFAGLSLQDLRFGKVNILGFLPMILIPLFYPETIKILLYPFCALLAIWSLLEVLRRSSRLPQDTLNFGFGDVLGVPVALAISWILAPLWGLVAFAVVTMVTSSYLMIKKKERIRFLPVLLPGVLAALALGILL